MDLESTKEAQEFLEISRGVAAENVSSFSSTAGAFPVLHYDKTWVFDQSEHAQGPIYIISSR